MKSIEKFNNQVQQPIFGNNTSSNLLNINKYK